MSIKILQEKKILPVYPTKWCEALASNRVKNCKRPSHTLGANRLPRKLSHLTLVPQIHNCIIRESK